MTGDHPLWTRARNDILLYSPYLGRALLSLELVVAADLGTCGTDGSRIAYDPVAVAAWSDAERAGVWVHEILHVLLGHHLRRGTREMRRWNIACDYEVNPYVADAGYVLPDGALVCPPKWAVMNAEQIYDLLPPGGSAPQWGVVEDAPPQPGRTPAQAFSEATQRWRQMRAQSRWGTLPAALARTLAEPKPVATLADVVSQVVALALDYDNETWAPPSRRCALLPGPVERPDGYVVIAVDTSGSMRDSDVRIAISLALGVTGLARLDVIYADAAVQSVVEDVQCAASLVYAAKGGGGTDFRPALAEIARRAPDIALYITDGCGEYGPPQPGIIWVSPTQPPWGSWVNYPTKES